MTATARRPGDYTEILERELAEALDYRHERELAGDEFVALDAFGPEVALTHDPGYDSAQVFVLLIR